MSEIDSARRVVLLARPGPARERMREALAQAGAAVALEADPLTADPGDVSASRPDVALIVLDTATDEALDRFDALLSDPAVEVLFEEADLVIAREGWDAARWVRHLAAKLHRSGDVLPPGSGPADVAPAAGPAPAAAEPAPSGRASEPPPLPEPTFAIAPPTLPEPTFASQPPPLPEPTLAIEPPPLPEPTFAIEPPPLPESVPMPAASAPTPAEAPQWALSDIPELPTLSEAAATEVAEAATRVVMPELESTAFDLPGATSLPPELPPLDMPATSSPGFQSTFDVNGDLAGLESSEISLAPLQLDEEFLTTSSNSVGPIGLELPGEADIEVVQTAPAAGSSPLQPVRFELELVDDSAPEGSIESVAPSDSQTVADRFQNDLADLHSRIASMELVVDRSPSQMRGAVLVLAGIGGPDAVRQLLGALPNNFPRAVLVQQRLDGGHYDKLVAQMQRATQLLVELAVPGRALESSSVYILAPTIGVETGPNGLVFTDTPGDLLASLPAGDSAVLMLSGSDPNQVDAVMKLSGGGALVAAQALDGCYDVAAPAALASRGGAAAKPQDLARRLAERWAA